MKFRPMLGADLSGSLGGITASHNRAGVYFRTRAIPVNPNTPAQISARNRFSFLQSRYLNVLSLDNQISWEDYAEGTPTTDALGQELKLSGRAMYTRTNSIRLQSQYAPIDEGPAFPGLATLTLPSIVSVADAGNILTFNFDNTDQWANDDQGFLSVFLSRGLSPNVLSFKGPFRYAGFVAGNATTPPAAVAAVTSPFSYQVGQIAYARFVACDGTGRISPDVIQNDDVQ